MLTKDKFYEILDEGREDNFWDFKEELSISKKVRFYEFLKDILAFSNSGGGYLLLGVKDETHELVGVSEEIDEAELAQKIESALSYSIDFKILYFNDKIDSNKKLGLIEIFQAKKICVSPKSYSSEKGIIVEQDIIYTRRGTRSIRVNGEQLNELVRRIQTNATYKFSESELQFIEKNRNSSYLEFKQFDDYLKGAFEFTASSFGDKITQLCSDQLKYNRLEVGKWIGFEEERINDYFNGIAYPSLEHILRASKYFEVPISFFFKPTTYSRPPIWENPLVSFCLIEKVINKSELLSINWGDFFSYVLWDMSKNICLFVEWIRSDYFEYVRNKENIFNTNRSDFLYEYLIDMSPEEVLEFKSFMSTQHYKIIGKASFDKEMLSRLPHEEFLYHFIGYSNDLVCRLINESIKSITVSESKIEVTYHFIEEIINCKYLRRDYDVDKISLKIYDNL
ncbi:ATP-binding protein [Paenibacillus profundus]|uniref:ATP-binding protein n=1 Tax=Paenibacillus profundus TaxID=1173085 RepID=A0ABS8YLG7_9BACL|nr:ATP-binding protein [Paenibacillus profundus]MCE5172700.1 ATP-binding protein [Paenibacillus profundus]